MNRPIKFRAWDERYSKILQWGEIIAGFMTSRDPSVGTLPFVTEFFGNESPFILMQFTGLHDKNGQEIYEGDILSWGGPGGENKIIEFKDGAFGTKDEFLAGLYLEASVIVGNIYEHPELISAL